MKSKCMVCKKESVVKLSVLVGTLKGGEVDYCDKHFAETGNKYWVDYWKRQDKK